MTTANGNVPKQPVRVAHVTLGLGMGGAEKLLVEFARHANRARSDLRFVSLTTRGTLAEEIEAFGWPVTALDEPPGLRPRLIFRLARLFRRWNLDVVHTHNSRPLVHAGPAVRLARVPGLIHTRHGQHYQASCRETAVFRLATHLADRVVCVSSDSAKISSREGIASSRVCTVKNGIDVARFGHVGPRVGGPVVMTGRLSPEKDPESLLRAVAIAAGKDPSFRLEIAGDGELLPALRRATCELQLVEHVRFLGEVRDVRSLLARASLFVLPSLTEGISLTLLEAMATGLPVVATRVGGNPEVVVDGQTGLLVPPGAPPDLARAMLQLKQDPERSRRMGLAGRERVERHFDARRMVAEYESLYLRVLS